jgi:hypothetical protein
MCGRYRHTPEPLGALWLAPVVAATSGARESRSDLIQARNVALPFRQVLRVHLTSFAALLASAASAQPLGVPTAAPDAASAEGHHHLFAPTPREQMRDMETDRPDTTESPYSVDAGHFQVEVDAVSGERDEGETELRLAATNLKVGLTSSTDLQLLFEPIVLRGGESALGDLTLRLKRNLWGNDGGKSALGLMPFIRRPTAVEPNGSSHAEAGLVLPFALELPAGFELGSMLEADVAYHEDHYGTDLIVSMTAGHALFGELEGYLELISETPLDAPPDSALTSSLGLTLGLDDDIRVDTGARLGINAAAPDLALFVGGSARY